jgi:F0F1-type ATP synthase membrane subunit c/vacuolar-type H+-ATPase subunit K
MISAVSYFLAVLPGGVAVTVAAIVIGIVLVAIAIIISRRHG